jgi:hypothetical protein
MTIDESNEGRGKKRKKRRGEAKSAERIGEQRRKEGRRNDYTRGEIFLEARS